MAPRLRSTVSVLLLGLGSLLLIDLFLSWRAATTVSIGGALRMHAASSGWVGWGLLTGVAVIVLLIVESVQSGTSASLTDGRVEGGSALVALVILGASIAAFVDRSVTLSMGGGVQQTTNAALHWPAYFGVALSVAIAAIAVVRVMSRLSLRLMARHEPA